MLFLIDISLFVLNIFSAIFIPDPKDGSLYAFGSAHDGLKVLHVFMLLINLMLFKNFQPSSFISDSLNLILV